MSRKQRPTRSRPAAGRAPRAPAPPLAAPAPLPPRSPAAIVAAAVAAACVVLSVSFLIMEPDFWQHLAVGKAIWTLRRVPTMQIWTWPSFGAPDVDVSWGFSALLWPFWRLGGIGGLYAWRWLSTLAVFALLWVAARRMGARSLTPLVVLVLCALVYRQRSLVRPETLAAVLLALEIWILETRRHGGRDRSPWLAAVAWAWANAHVSYYLGFVVLAFHLLGAHLERRSARGRAPAGAAEADLAPRPGPGRLWWVALAMAAVSFANPFGWRALWQPFEYILFWRHEPIYRNVVELVPVFWDANLKNGLPLIVAGWPLLLLWRARRRGWDIVELLHCACFTALGLITQRFLSVYALVAAPYLARDLDEWVRARRWPAWTARAWVRAALAAGACVGVGLAEWSRPELPLGIGVETREYPIQACRFMEEHDVRGRGFNNYAIGGYLLWRFWPQRDRLPFMDIHQAGGPELRTLYVNALAGPGGWRTLDGRYHFDYVLLNRPRDFRSGPLEMFDADTAWAAVFLDDAGALLVRRGGALQPLADRFAYRLLPAGGTDLWRLRAACLADTALRRRVVAELERQLRASPYNAAAHHLLGDFAFAEGKLAEARGHYREATRVDPLALRLHERLGLVALTEERPAEALREFRLERRLRVAPGGLDLRFGQAWQQLGQLDRARACYRREVERGPYPEEASDSLNALAKRPGG